MDELFATALGKIERTIKLEPITLPDELHEVKFPLSILEMHCYNWQAVKVRKVYAMRMTVKMPALDILGMAIYPENDCDVPIMVFDLSCTKKKVVAYINLVPLFNNQSYFNRYIDPLKPIREKYNQFPLHKVPEWMCAYHTAYTIYSMPDRAVLNELKACALEYLSVYLEMLSAAHRIEDPEYTKRIEQARAAYINDLLTRDASQKMLAKLIGKNRTSRIFNEVLV